MKMAPPLQAGDAVGIAAPSGAVEQTAQRRRIMHGVRLLERWGLKTVYSEQIHSTHRSFAGTHRRRLRELQRLIDSPDIKALVFARGGFGVHHLLPELKLGKLKKYPKRIIGYSDMTMLLDRIRKEVGLVSYYGPTLGALGSTGGASVRRDYRRILLGRDECSTWTLAKSGLLKKGRAEGRLLGGCLSLLSMSVGTAFEFQSQGGILLLEDINESVYRYERLLLHLQQSGKLKGVRGILVSAIETGRQQSSRRSWLAMLKEVLADFKGPVAYGFAFGHLKGAHTLPLGARAQLDTRKGHLALL